MYSSEENRKKVGAGARKRAKEKWGDEDGILSVCSLCSSGEPITHFKGLCGQVSLGNTDSNARKPKTLFIPMAIRTRVDCSPTVKPEIHALLSTAEELLWKQLTILEIGKLRKRSSIYLLIG